MISRLFPIGVGRDSFHLLRSLLATIERKLTKEIYEADEGGNVRRRPMRTFLDQIGQVLEKGHVRSTRNRRAEFDERGSSERCLKKLLDLVFYHSH
jgi:hypothetical protein